MRAAIAAVGVLLVSAGAGAQSANEVATELDPIECYWRTSAAAVRVGERFTVQLTCGVIETAAMTVAPDQSRMDPAVVQLQPFEVIGGRRAPDITTPSRRFFQYEYTLRYIGEEIGKDLAVPALTLAYRVQNRVQAGSAAVESREREYILPPRPVRILSLLPPVAADIRDVPPPTFAAVESHRFRASVLRILSLAFIALSVVVGIWALSAAFRSRRTGAVIVRHVSDAASLRGVARDLEEVARQRAGSGWDSALAARALGALRIAATIDARHPVSQTPVPSEGVVLPGQLRVPSRWRQAGTVLISGSATPQSLAVEQRRAESEGTGRASRLGELSDTLTEFSAAVYGRADTSDTATLDSALASGRRLVSAIRSDHTWLALTLRALARSAADLRTRAWAR